MSKWAKLKCKIKMMCCCVVDCSKNNIDSIYNGADPKNDPKDVKSKKGEKENA